MKRNLALILALILILTACISCNINAPESTTAETTGTAQTSETTQSTSETTEPLPDSSDATLNGVDIADYVIVYSQAEPDYNKNAADYIQACILDTVGVKLPVKTDAADPFEHEIIVGETTRSLSKSLDAETAPLEFAFTANKNSIAMEGDYFVIAAAAYYFVSTYIISADFDATIPETVTVESPIVEAPNNYIFLIGDGMGLYQTKIFEYVQNGPSVTSDGESRFYGYMLPYQCSVVTNSLSGVTDSAAGGTALATGYKTINGYIGKDKDLNDVMNLPELAHSLGMAAGVMSTEATTGATPAAFSVHADSRGDTNDIYAAQLSLKNQGFFIETATNTSIDRTLTKKIREMLTSLAEDEDGFFLMYEEAYIDKECHNNDLAEVYKKMYRFNQAIGLFMEFAFYNPDTMIIITADHETGGLTPDENGKLKFTSDDHTGTNVLMFSYGIGTEIFDGIAIENVQIPKTIAKMWGVEDFGDTTSPYPALELK